MKYLGGWTSPSGRRVERVGDAGAGADDEGAMDGGPEPGAVCVPPQCALLPLHGEPVAVALIHYLLT
jgi:hypothetical protein